MIVTATVTQKCWDSITSQLFEANQVCEGFDTESPLGKRLSTLTGARGKYIFQYPGHETYIARQKAAPEKPVKEQRALKQKRVWTDEQRKAQGERLKAARQKKLSASE